MNLPKYKIHSSKDGQFYYTLVGGNGEVMNTSETYHTKQACRKGIRAARRNSVIAITEDWS